jgi:hypothetical protein
MACGLSVWQNGWGHWPLTWSLTSLTWVLASFSDSIVKVSRYNFCASHKSQASTWISNVISCCLICVQWVKMRGGCWYWWNTFVWNHFHSVKILLFSSAKSCDFDGTPGTEILVSMYTTKTPIDMCRFNVRSST